MANPRKIKVAELDLGLESLEKKVKQAEKLLNLEGLKEQVPDRLKQTFNDLSKTLDKLYKTKPVEGASSNELNKYEKEITKFTSKLETVISTLSNLKIDPSKLQDSLKVLKDLKKGWEDAANAVKTYRENLGSKDALNPSQLEGKLKASGKAKEAPTGYRKDIEKAERDAIAAARRGDTKGIAAAFAISKGKLRNRLSNLPKEDDEDFTEEDFQQILAINEFLQSIEKRIHSLRGQAQHLKELEVTSESSKAELNEKTTQEMGKMNAVVQENIKLTEDAKEKAEELGQAYTDMGEGAKELEGINKTFDRIGNRIKYMLDMTSVFAVLRRMVRGVVQDYKELDKEFNDIAIVSKYSTQQMWDSFAQVNQIAQEYGVTTKNVLEVQNLYYHQGKEMAEVNKLTAQTLTLAKITGMEYGDATNKLTAALNAYKLNAEDAVRVTDTVAALSANAATSSEELMTALTKTASIAANAGVSLENTEVFLTKMIETTREAPENLGTAMKTILARFGEVKDAIDETGESIEMMDVNKVGKALQTIGISLLDSSGQMRDAEEVLMELSSKWDDLDRNTQRYIATQAAGSRQQSRFIAMMENYDRTVELMNIAQNSAGTGAKQLAKAQESLETALNKIKASWQELYSKILKASWLKTGLKLVNDFLKALNKAPGILGPVTAAISALVARTAVLKTVEKLTGNIAKNLAKKGMINMGGAAEQGGGLAAFLGKTEKFQVGNIKGNISQKFDSVKDLKEKIKLERVNMKIRKGEIKTVEDLNKAKKALGITEELETNISSTENIVDGVSVGVKEAESAATAELEGNTSGLAIAETSETAVKEVETGSHIANTIALIAEQIAAGNLLVIIGLLVIAIGILVGVVYLVAKAFDNHFNEVVGKDTTEILDRVTEKQEKFNESLEKLKTVRDAADTVEQYRDSLFLTTEQTEELNEATQQLAEAFPDLIAYYDEEGNAVLKDNAAIRERIDLLKQETQEKNKDYIEAKTKAAQEGIVEGSYQKESLQNIFGNALANVGISTEDSEEATKQLMRKITSGKIKGTSSKKGLFYGDSFFTDWAMMFTGVDEAYQKLIEGGGITRYSLSGLINKELSDEEYAKIMKEAYGKDIENFHDFYKLLIDTGAIESGDWIADLELLPEEVQKQIYNEMTGQFAYIKDAYAQAITNQLNIDDLDIDAKNKGELGMLFAEIITDEFTTEDAIKYIEQQSPLKLEELLSKVDLNDVKLKEFMSSGSLDFSKYLESIGLDDENDPLHQALLAKFEKEFTLTEEDLQEIEAVYGESLEGLTLVQINAMQKTIGQMRKNYGSGNEAIADKRYGEIISTLKDSARDYTKALNTLNSADLTTTEGVAKFAKEMSLLGVSTSDTTKILQQYANGIDNLPLYNTDELLKTLTKRAEEFDKSIEALDNLKEGKGTIEDLSSAISVLISTLEGADLVNTISKIGDAITITGEGILMDMGVIGEAGDALLNQQLSGDQVLIGLYDIVKQKSFEAAKQAAIAAAGTNQQIINSINAVKSMEELAKIASRISGINDNEDWKKATSDWSTAEVSTFMIQAFDKSGKASEEMLGASEKAADAANALKEALEAIVEYLRDFDRYANLNGIISTLEDKLNDLKFELTFTTNSKNLRQVKKEILNTINSQIAGNRAGVNTARTNLAARRNVLETSDLTKGFFSFDELGNAIINFEKMNKLEHDIFEATKAQNEVQKEVLENQKKAIEDNLKAYQDDQKALKDYAKALQSNVTALKDFFKETYQSVVDLENKLIEVRQKEEDKELELVKKKYDAIKEEDNKYLDSVRKMIDKERALREQADQEEEVRDKERKLAQMKMDTSGIYASEIKELEKELKKDYRDFRDANIDRMVSQLEEENTVRGEALDKEVYYLETALNRKRELMTEYNEWAKEMYAEGPDSVIEYFKTHDEAYLKASESQKKLLEQQYKDLATAGCTAADMIEKGFMTQVQTALENAEAAAGSFEEAINQYADTATVKNGEVESSIAALTKEYETFVGTITDNGQSIIQYYSELAAAIKSAAKAQEALNAAKNNQGGINSGGDGGGEVPKASSKKLDERHIWDIKQDRAIASKYSGVTEEFLADGRARAREQAEKNRNKDEKEQSHFKFEKVTTLVNWKIPDKHEYEMGDDGPYYGKWMSGTGNYTAWARLTGFYGVDNEEEALKKYLAQASGTWAWKTFDAYKKYASGGLINYTGPAWVDGSKTKPEAFLSANDTANIAKLRDVLSLVFDSPNPQYPNSSISNSNAIYNINIEVGSIDDDYGIDKAIEKVEKSITDASKYRNITILKKQ